MKEYNFDTVEEFFDELNEGENQKLRKYTVWSKYYKQMKKEDKEYDIIEVFEKNASPRRSFEVNIVNDDIAIVKEYEFNRELGYYAYVDNCRSFYRWNTFEKALICALCIKSGNKETVTDYIVRLLDPWNMY